MNSSNNSSYEFGAFLLDGKERLLLRDGQEITLTPKAFETLLLLVENSGHVLTKEEMLNSLWPDTFVEEANLTNNISVLRKALGDGSESQQYIKTVPRVGYRFVASVKQVQKDMALAVDARAGVLSSPVYFGGRIKSRVRAFAIILTVLVIASAALLSSSYLTPRRPPILTEQDTILIAEFDNKTGDTVFDSTLKQALAMHLAQSPFFNVFSDQKARETLEYMSCAPDERVVGKVAREICERRGIKAMLSGSIAQLGSHYIIGLEAINAHTGDVIAREQVEAENKEQVLRTLGAAADKIRETLGESLSSIQRFDAPLDQATTCSLDALKAFSLANDQHRKGRYFEAVPLYRHAIELDPNFALAYARLSSVYGQLHIQQQDLAIKFAEKAFQLRERVTEREKLVISSRYYDEIARDCDEQNRVLELWKTLYPREPGPLNNLGVYYTSMAQFDKAIAEFREAMRLDPQFPNAYHNLGVVLMLLNRFGEAKEVFEQSRQQKLGVTENNEVIYQMAFAEGDTVTMDRMIEGMIRWQEGYRAPYWQAQAAEFSGELRQAHKLRRRAIGLAHQEGLQGFVDKMWSSDAKISAVVGQCHVARESLSRLPTLPHMPDVFFDVGIALALCGETSQAQSLVDQRIKKYPKDRVANEIWAPLIQAAIEIERRNYGHAIRLLQDASRYKGITEFWYSYLLGQAYLAEGNGAAAGVEFREMLGNRGWWPLSLLYSLAHRGLARAAVLTNDNAKARKAYEDFFAIWKDADPDVPILIEARKEYANLK